MFEFVDDIEQRVIALQQNYNNALKEFQTLLQNYQKLKTEHQKLLDSNKEAYSRLDKLLQNLPAHLTDNLAHNNDD